MIHRELWFHSERACPSIFFFCSIETPLIECRRDSREMKITDIAATKLIIYFNLIAWSAQTKLTVQTILNYDWSTSEATRERQKHLNSICLDDVKDFRISFLMSEQLNLFHFVYDAINIAVNWTKEMNGEKKNQKMKFPWWNSFFIRMSYRCVSTFVDLWSKMVDNPLS